jgi:hypothetical protein
LPESPPEADCNLIQNAHPPECMADSAFESNCVVPSNKI